MGQEGTYKGHNSYKPAEFVADGNLPSAEFLVDKELFLQPRETQESRREMMYMLLEYHQLAKGAVPHSYVLWPSTHLCRLARTHLGYHKLKEGAVLLLV